MLKYPIVFDKFATDFSGTGLAVLINAKNIKIREVINGEYMLSILLPRTDPAWQYIQPDNFINIEGQNFRIRSFDEVRDNTGKLLSNIQCEHVWYDAVDCKHLPDVTLIGVTPQAVLEEAFEGTRFTIGTIEITTLTDIFLSKANPMQVALKLIDNVGGELLRDNWTINLLNKRGADNGIQFRIGKNISTVKRTTDATNVITRLYPYGKDSIEISNVNGGLAYLDSPLIGNYDKPKVGFIDYKDIEDNIELKNTALEEWSTDDQDGIDKPRVTYDAQVVELKKLLEFGDAEAFSLGDVITIIDDGLNANTRQRIVEYEYYPFEPQRSTVKLINYDVKSYQEKQLGTMISGFTQTSRYVDSVTTSQGDINAASLENIQAKLSTEINVGLSKKACLHDYGDVWVDDLNNPTKAMGIVNGMFAIANSKKANGDWDWRTFGDGDGFFADLIIAGTLMGIIIKSLSSDGKLAIKLADYQLKFYDFNSEDLKGDMFGNPSGLSIYGVGQVNIGTATFDDEEQILTNSPGFTISRNLIKCWQTLAVPGIQGVGDPDIINLTNGCYIEALDDGLRLHFDSHNYLHIGDGFIDGYAGGDSVRLVPAPAVPTV